MRLLLVDSMGMLYRGHFAMLRNPLTAPDGMITSGLHHLVSETISLIEQLGPDAAAVVFDSREPGFRDSIFKEYKANRQETPEALILQAEAAPVVLEALGIPVLASPGWEADDIIATCAVRASSAGWSVSILSSDKDLLQLVDDKVSVIQPGRPGKPSLSIGPEQVPGLMGVPPGMIADLLALAGDSSDNIPGARGIGPKTAVRLLGEYGSLAGVYESLERIEPASTREKLRESTESVRMSLELVHLRVDAPVAGDPGSLSIRPPASDALGVLGRYGMNGMIARIGNRLEDMRAVSGGSSGVPPSGDAESLEARLEGGALPFVAMLPDSGSIHDLPELTAVCVDSPEETWCFETGTDGSRALPSSLVDSLREGGYAAFDSKALFHKVMAVGIEAGAASGDALLADYVLLSGAPGRSPAGIAADLLGTEIPDIKRLTGRIEAADIVRTGARILGKLEEALARDRALDNVYRSLEIPLAPILARMEGRGMALDMPSLEAVRRELAEDLGRLEEEAALMLGVRVNLRSPSQVSAVLFEQLGLPRIRRTGGGGDSSGGSVLQALSGAHPFVDLVTEHREISKLVSTYLDRLPSFVSPSTGLVHTSFNQAVTATGRLSSSNPNLQNIPIRTERGRSVRKCFRAPREGDLLVSADYSQIELRILAHLAGEGALRKAYREEADIHSRTAEAVLGSATPEHRRKAKEINFSIVYGISAHGLAQRLGIDRGAAAGIINRYFEAYPEVESFFRKCVRDAESTGETRTMLGRRRSFRELASARGSIRKSLERMAVNTTVQGSAADLMKLGMLGAFDRLRRNVPAAGLVLQVHDELVASCPPEDAREVSELLEQSMETAFELAVPIRVETGYGPDWLEAHA